MRKGVFGLTASALISAAIAALIGVAVLPACRGARPVIAPMPADLWSLEGHGSLKATLDDRSAKSSFSFLLDASGRGKIDVSDPLGRTAAEIYLLDAEAYLVLAAERVYWKTSPEEIFEKFLGFRLSFAELLGLLSGRWRAARVGPGTERTLAEWTFAEDAAGRTNGGRRDDFRFSVLDFFPNSPVPRRLNFQSTLGDGRLTLLAVAFNVSVPEGILFRGFLTTHASKTWEEVERILRHEN